MWIINRMAEDIKSEIEPWNSGRSSGRLLHDLGIVICALEKYIQKNARILDLGAGRFWVGEFLARIGFWVVGTDLCPDMAKNICERKSRWNSLHATYLHGVLGDGHLLPFSNDSFEAVIFFDALHHMESFPKVFRQVFRVLKTGGRVICVEPGAIHSKSPETVSFLKQNQMQLGPGWIERDIVLGEVEKELRSAGFSQGLRIIPKIHPINHPVYDLPMWTKFIESKEGVRQSFCDYLSDINYNHHLIFYADKA